MGATQILLLAFVILVIVLRVKKYLTTRSMKNYSSTEVKQLLKNNNSIVLLDVRTDGERKSGAIKPSIHIPLHEITLKTEQLKKYGSREIICYCQTGSRSVSAAVKLRKLGFNSANLTGGYLRW
ncbi:MAG: rhodanese-like domain-containing protein [Ignavibacteriales bacterium]|nr:rhodanese-like domain-containing protein [Ignavibacteriales bacterium]